MPAGLDFGGATTGFQNLADAGVFGPRIDFPVRGVEVPIFGAPVLDVLQFGLDVFQTVRGGGAVAAPAATSIAVPITSSVVPVPAQNVVSRFTGDFSPGATQAVMMRMPGGMAGGAVAAGKVGVAFVLRKMKANTGIRLTTKKIVSAIRQFGPDAVASWSGVTMLELMIIWDRGSRRVKRRFTKRDRSRGRSYIRFLKRNVDELKSLGCGPRARRRT